MLEREWTSSVDLLKYPLASANVRVPARSFTVAARNKRSFQIMQVAGCGDLQLVSHSPRFTIRNPQFATPWSLIVIVAAVALAPWPTRRASRGRKEPRP